MCCGQLLLPWQEPVSSPSGYCSMSVVSAPFWHATGTVCGSHVLTGARKRHKARAVPGSVACRAVP